VSHGGVEQGSEHQKHDGLADGDIDGIDQKSAADVYTELLWDGNSYYPTYITDSTDGYPVDPIISYVDVEPGETANVRIAFEVPKELGESETPLRYHIVYKNGDKSDGVYIDLR